MGAICFRMKAMLTQVLAAAACCLLAATPCATAHTTAAGAAPPAQPGAYLVGIGKADITGPCAEVNLMVRAGLH